MSHFEIAGDVYENGILVIEDLRSSEKHQEVTINDQLFATALSYVVPAVVGDDSPRDYDIVRASRAPGRARRAKTALSIAAGLVLIDGPLPIGDAIAAGFLAIYAGYELGLAYQDVTQ